jgi:hypothetical protein
MKAEGSTTGAGGMGADSAAGVGAIEGALTGAELVIIPQLGSQVLQPPQLPASQVGSHELQLLQLWQAGLQQRREPNSFCRRPGPQQGLWQAGLQAASQVGSQAEPQADPQAEPQGSAAQVGSQDEPQCEPQAEPQAGAEQQLDPQGSQQLFLQQGTFRNGLKHSGWRQQGLQHLRPSKPPSNEPHFGAQRGLQTAAQVGSQGEPQAEPQAGVPQAEPQGSAAQVGSQADPQGEWHAGVPQGDEQAGAAEAHPLGQLEAHAGFDSQHDVEQPQPFAPSIRSSSSKPKLCELMLNPITRESTRFHFMKPRLLIRWN